MSDNLSGILECLKEVRAVDFAAYRQMTISRRIETTR